MSLSLRRWFPHSHSFSFSFSFSPAASLLSHCSPTAGLLLLLAPSAHSASQQEPYVAPPLPTLIPNTQHLTPSTLVRQLDRLVAPVAEHAAVGLCVCSLDRGDELYAHNADAAFTPASNQKLLTAAAALDLLGPAACFTTQVLTLGARHGASLDGDLVLRGGGDPMLTTESLAGLAEAVAAAGIRQVTGHVRGDDSVFDRHYLGAGWSWDDEGSPDAAPISGLTLNGNTVSIEVQPAARPGLPLLVRLDPPAAPLALRVQAISAPPGEPSSLRVDRVRARDEVIVSGRLPQNSAPVTVKVTVEDPPLYAAAVFTALLRARGVRVAGGLIVLGTPAAAVLLSEIRSPPLSAIIRRMNKTSDNLIAEMLLKAMGRGSTGEPGSAESGRARLRAFLERSGLQGPALLPADGSGLSRYNLVSPRNLVRLLAAMDRHPAGPLFFDSLPIAGVDGTLRRRMIGTAAVGKVRAKTGTLLHVTALSGVVTARNGERLAFSILTDNYPGSLSAPAGPRAMEDAIAASLAEFQRE